MRNLLRGRDNGPKHPNLSLHSHLGNVSPVDYERMFLEDSKRLLKYG